MSFSIGLSQMPLMRVVQKQTLFKTCPHCGHVNEVGGIGESGSVIILCWACKEPLFDKNSRFIPLKGQDVHKFVMARKRKASII